jgi:hypothetical protein
MNILVFIDASLELNFKLQDITHAATPGEARLSAEEIF